MVLVIIFFYCILCYCVLLSDGAVFSVNMFLVSNVFLLHKVLLCAIY